jgi:predicted nucleic acid-binding protein
VRPLLDADVLIGALDRNDPHHRRARALFTRWRDDQDACAVSVVNLTEVLIAPSADVSKLAAAREAIAALGVTVHQPNEAIGVEAARLRQRHPISLPDAYCLATHGFHALVVRSEDPEGSQARRRQSRLNPEHPVLVRSGHDFAVAA